MGRLLREASSYELSQWQAFFAVDAEIRKEQARRAEEDRRLMGG